MASYTKAPYGTPQPMASSIELRHGGKRRHGKKPYYPSKKPALTPKKVTFQKKLVVLKFLGEDVKQFTLKDSRVLLRGLLPEIDVEATEAQVRSIIANMIANSSEEMSYCSSYCFEFIEATGKNLCVPAKQTGFEWTGKAIKSLAGTGQVYVRLLFDPASSSSESDFKDYLPTRSRSGNSSTSSYSVVSLHGV